MFGPEIETVSLALLAQCDTMTFLQSESSLTIFVWSGAQVSKPPKSR